MAREDSGQTEQAQAVGVCWEHLAEDPVKMVNTLARVLEGAWEFDQASLHVFCGSGEGLCPCPSRYVLGGCAPGVWGRWPFVTGHLISVLSEPEFGSHFRQ